MIADVLLAQVAAEVLALSEQLARLGDGLVARLRDRFPEAHFSICSDDDTPPGISPATGNRFCNLYYVDGRNHCLKLTTDAETATGLLVAMLDPET